MTEDQALVTLRAVLYRAAFLAQGMSVRDLGDDGSIVVMLDGHLFRVRVESS